MQRPKRNCLPEFLIAKFLSREWQNDKARTINRKDKRFLSFCPIVLPDRQDLPELLPGQARTRILRRNRIRRLHENCTACDHCS